MIVALLNRNQNKAHRGGPGNQERERDMDRDRHRDNDRHRDMDRGRHHDDRHNRDRNLDNRSSHDRHAAITSISRSSPRSETTHIAHSVPPRRENSHSNGPHVVHTSVPATASTSETPRETAREAREVVTSSSSIVSSSRPSLDTREATSQPPRYGTVFAL